MAEEKEETKKENNEEHEHHEEDAPAELAEPETTSHGDHNPKEEAHDLPSERPAAPSSRVHKFKAWMGTKKGKLTLAIIAGVGLLVATLFIVPATRYGILGTFVKKDVILSLIDSKTSKPVSNAQVDITGQSGKSDNQGKVTFKGVAVGPQKVVIKKKYYKDSTQTINVWLTKTAEPEKMSVEATGRQVPVKVVNKISGQPVDKATITAQESSTITDDKGEAVLIMPPDQTSLNGTVKAEGYNDAAIVAANTEQADEKNTFTITPTGKLYFLSKRTGKINVMKSDLDGANPQVVLEGTGKEEDGGTILLASRDWRYLMLKARRDSEKPKLYSIDTSNDKLTVADEGNAEFTLSGWADHIFVYRVYRIGGNNWQGGHESIKSYNAENGKLAKLDTLEGAGSDFMPYFYQSYATDPILFGNEVIFSKYWGRANAPTQMNDKKSGVYSIKADGSGKKAITEVNAIDLGGYASPGFYQLKQYGAAELYIRTYFDGKVQRSWEYEHGKLAEKQVNDSDMYKAYPTYLFSPSGSETLWSESRDGKDTLFVGNADGEDGKEVVGLNEYLQYGWYTNNYILVSKKGSELYIVSKQNPTKPLKITDYHKPAYSFFNYGGGYGGL